MSWVNHRNHFSHGHTGGGNAEKPAWADRHRILMKQLYAQTMKHTRHADYELYYHIVFTPKPEHIPMSETTHDRLTPILENICDEKGLQLVYSVLRDDYIHVYVSSPPKNKPSLLVNWLKGISARQYNSKYEDKISWRRSYYISASSPSGTPSTIEQHLDATLD